MDEAESCGATSLSRGGKRALLRRLAGPPRWWHTGLAVTATVVLGIGQSCPVAPSGALLIAVLLCKLVLGPLLIGIFVLHLTASTVEARTGSTAAAPLRRRWWAWLVLPACVLLHFGARWHNYPLEWRFHASHAAFQTDVDRIVAELPPDPDGTFEWLPLDKRLGLYQVRAALVELDANGGTARIEFVTGGLGAAAWGFAYDVARSNDVLEPELPPGWLRWINRK